MVNLKKINSIIQNFKIASVCTAFSELQFGHINDTYLITTPTNKQFVLQKTNTEVFKNIEAVFHNKQLLNIFLESKKNQLNYKFVSYVSTYSDSLIYKDDSNNYWSLMLFIKDSKTIIIAENKNTVFEAGKLYGDFLYQTNSLDITKFKDIIQDFHSVPFRLFEFKKALKNTIIDVKPVQVILDTISNYRSEMCILSGLIETNKLPLRLTHNDTKLSNILFDSTNKGIAVIDLDTLMPGIVHFDFGDAIRSICSTVKEDERDLDTVKIKLEFYEYFCKGYAYYTKDILQPIEIEYLPLAIKTMIYIMGLRFFTDYLNGNIYYKIEYTEHNLIRAKNQFKLLESVSDNYDQIVNITQKYFSK